MYDARAIRKKIPPTEIKAIFFVFWETCFRGRGIEKKIRRQSRNEHVFQRSGH